MVCLTFLLLGCTNSVAEELKSYMVELEYFAALEEEVLLEYESVTGHQYVNDLITYQHLKDVVIPLYHDFIGEIESIVIKSKEIREVHEIYIDGSNKQLNAIISLLGAIEAQDYTLVAKGNDMLAEARTVMRTFQMELQDLLEEYNVEWSIEPYYH